jgi:hypothetical protein
MTTRSVRSFLPVAGSSGKIAVVAESDGQLLRHIVRGLIKKLAFHDQVLRNIFPTTVEAIILIKPLHQVADTPARYGGGLVV